MSQSKLVHYIYVWRLDAEKWVHYILEAFKQLYDTWVYTVSLDIFWRWNLSSDIHKFADQYENVTYHWFQKKSKVFELWEKSDFCLMPSRFLETFWLSALDSLSVGVPVIAPAKWWLRSFVFPELALNFLSTSELIRIIRKSSYIKNDNKKLEWMRIKSKKIYKLYLWEKRYATVLNQWLPQKFLLVNDYWANQGWIETLLEEIHTWLSKNGHISVNLVGTSRQLSQKQRYLWLIKTIANIPAALSIRRLDNNVWLIRWHSVHRQLWRFPLRVSSNTIKHWIMIHDMWLLHPFPAFVEDENQIQRASSLSWRINEWVLAKWWTWFPLLIAKRCTVWLIRRQIRSKKMMVQLPSAYLRKHIERKKILSHKIVVLPHFILPRIDDW